MNTKPGIDIKASPAKRRPTIQSISFQIARKLVIFVILLFLLNIHGIHAEPSLLGQTGLVNMPDARIAPNGTLRFGLSKLDPYSALWSSISFFPRLELSARYTETKGVDAFVGRPDDNYGDYKDKAFDAKLILVNESGYWPQLAIGTQDFLGTRLYDANFVTLSKKVDELDISLGYGDHRIDGAFGGIRYTPKWMKGWSLVAEYDATDYKNDRNANESGAVDRGGMTYALNYRWGWLGAQLAYQGGEVGLNGYVAIPLMQNEFIVKFEEPKPYTVKTARVGIAEWTDDNDVENNRQNSHINKHINKYQNDLIKALELQGFKNIRMSLDFSKDSTVSQDTSESKDDKSSRFPQLQVAIATPRISLVGRAVGRAVRTALLMAPAGLQSIKVTYYTLSDLPVVSYEFNDLAQLDAFFAGQVTYGELLNSLVVRYVSPEDTVTLERPVNVSIGTQLMTVEKTQETAIGSAGNNEIDNPVEKEGDNQSESEPDDSSELTLHQNEDGQIVSLRKVDKSLNSFIMTPLQIGVFFNDPSGAFKYDWFAKAHYQKYFGSRLFLQASARMTVLENVSDVVQPSNSTLPHVRTDVAEYKREKGVKVDSLLMNKFLHLRPRLYARWSAGIYEEMFGGTGGQILYMPKLQNWAVDLSVDWVKQRDFDGNFGFQDYQTVTALLNLHYRIPKQGITLTARSGRFLAKDEGLRFEFARRFRSGFKIGAWYTRTNGEDTTGPGTPRDPYMDKGVFIQIPLNTMLTKDTRAAPIASISPWTRDVGQIVKSPADLYDIMENVLLFDRPEHHLLSGFHD